MKPVSVSRGFKAVIGNGIFFSEGEDHKFQRRLLNPSFAPAHIKTLVPTFMSKIKMMIEIYDQKTANGPAVFTQVPLLSRLALDAIGETSFGVNLHAIDTEDNELVRAYHRLSAPIEEDPMFFYLNSFVPGWRHMPTASNKRMDASKAIFKNACREVLLNRVNDVYERKVEGKDRDLLSILLKDEQHKWTVEEIENQLMTSEQLV